MTITREQILASLQTDWGTFVERFQRLTPEAKSAYLQQQGYTRFADLLAHVSAWWQEGLAAVPAMLSDPAYTSPEEDVDQFNAQAVDRLRDLNESAIIAIFSDLRQQWIELVNGLPAAAFQDERINWRLHIEIIGHLTSIASRKSAAEDFVFCLRYNQVVRRNTWLILLVLSILLSACESLARPPRRSIVHTEGAPARCAIWLSAILIRLAKASQPPNAGPCS